MERRVVVPWTILPLIATIEMPPKKSSTKATAVESGSNSEGEDMAQTRQQPELSDSLMTILQFLEKRDEGKEERRCAEEDRRREEEERKEALRQHMYREEAEERERKLLALLDSKEKAHQKHELNLLEKNKKLKSVPTWKDNDTPADFLRRFEQVMKCNGEPKNIGLGPCPCT